MASKTPRAERSAALEVRRAEERVEEAERLARVAEIQARERQKAWHRQRQREWAQQRRAAIAEKAGRKPGTIGRPRGATSSPPRPRKSGKPVGRPLKDAVRQAKKVAEQAESNAERTRSPWRILINWCEVEWRSASKALLKDKLGTNTAAALEALARLRALPETKALVQLQRVCKGTMGATPPLPPWVSALEAEAEAREVDANVRRVKAQARLRREAVRRATLHEAADKLTELLGGACSVSVLSTVVAEKVRQAMPRRGIGAVRASDIHGHLLRAAVEQLAAGAGGRGSRRRSGNHGGTLERVSLWSSLQHALAHGGEQDRANDAWTRKLSDTALAAEVPLESLLRDLVYATLSPASS